MISIMVDEAYAFDYLSILEVKSERVKTKQSEEAFKNCLNFLKGQLGSKKFVEVRGSDYYDALFDANCRVWDLVDKAKRNEVTAQDVDRGNFLRWKCKKALQDKFFGREFSEEKSGYDLYEKK